MVKKPKSNYRCKWNENVVTTKEHIKTSLQKAAIVGTRTEKLCRGKISDPMLKRKGHIPGAVSLPYSLVFRDDRTFDDAGKLKRTLDDMKDKEIIMLCCKGRHASSWWFVLSEVPGYRNVKMYDGSMEEWCSDKDAPLIEGKNNEKLDIFKEKNAFQTWPLKKVFSSRENTGICDDNSNCKAQSAIIDYNTEIKKEY